MPLAAMDLTRLSQAQDVIVVRNKKRGITVFTDDLNKLTVVWEGAGHVSGQDVRECSAIFLRNPDFRQAILLGILEIEEAPEALQVAMDNTRAEYMRRQDAMANSQQELRMANNRTISKGVSCIAPVGRGELCGSPGLAMGQNPAERPPLCSEHEHMASQYAAYETGLILPDGKSEIAWKRASLISGA